MGALTKLLRLYVHIPFCVRKCFYCDFLSFPGTKEAYQDYVKLMLQEIEQMGKRFQGYLVTSVFIGGGTPSILPVALMDDIMTGIFHAFQVQDQAEITMECNPGTVTEQDLLAYYKMGINRLSLGLQSAQDEELRSIGRIHDYNAFLKTYKGARNAQFENINIDLMSALPNQTLISYQNTLEKVLELQPEHISSYSLIIEEGTDFYDRQQSLALPTEIEERKMYQYTKERLEQMGYHRYEISNYAKTNRECAHNIGYWKRDSYLGLGLGAASLVEECRFHNPKQMEQYGAYVLSLNEQEKEPLSKCKGLEDFEVLNTQAQMEEYMFLGLRMMEGVSKQKFAEIFDCSMDSIYGEVIREHTAKGLMREENDSVFLTDRGIDVSNYVLSDFLL